MPTRLRRLWAWLMYTPPSIEQRKALRKAKRGRGKRDVDDRDR